MSQTMTSIDDKEMVMREETFEGIGGLNIFFRSWQLPDRDRAEQRSRCGRKSKRAKWL